MQLPLLGKVKSPLRWFLGLMAASILLVGSGTYFLSGREANKLDLEQLTVSVTEQDLTVKIEANGTVVPVKSVNISPKNAGILAKLYVDQGEIVEEGQRLAEMENAELQAQYLQVKANLEEAKARLAEARAGSRQEEIAQAQARLGQAEARLQEARSRIPEQIQQAEAQVDAARARYDLAQKRLDRNQELVAQGAIAQDRFDEVENEVRSAQANLLEAQRRLEQTRNTNNPEIAQLQASVAEAEAALAQLREGARPEEIERLQAAVAATEAQVVAAEVRLEDTVITAPFAGIITQKYATEGAFVTPTTSASNTASATSSSILAIAEGLEVLANVPEVDVGQLKPGQPVEIIADAYPEEVFQGEVELIAPEAVVEQNVTSFEVRVSLQTGQDRLRSGMNVDVTFLGNTLKDTLVVPTVAIVTREGETGVMVPDEDRLAEFRPVTIGLTLENQTQILSGLQAGELVFIDLPESSQPKLGVGD
ncbi:efflux RND transporter periplasmic adaptor subunit [Oscillatoria salina]|uniref:efflux RND transporter periplasmic adaptor subunit n=1 Tax=Oscillatoria salina TaxID=331517 RepID=UPI0013B6039A|nr:efflux RND transporter periplasmic adaptor subunit [Oscillatoria salina]MBZ8178560.1 efflux RND transporter periplasmic adaptor subunit [Oscillatoria salina IIICB1]NET90893.1 efflux RND transporter periplasmic adaptor subunit [Kamptonema sp. SIO1D9]